jgi:hypothetical protein
MAFSFTVKRMFRMRVFPLSQTLNYLLKRVLTSNLLYTQNMNLIYNNSYLNLIYGTVFMRVDCVLTSSKIAQADPS